MKICDITIVCIAYNQVNYIRDAMEGFLSQRGPFSFEIIVNDDCSDDGTTEVLLDYESKHPDQIKVLTHSKNHHGKICGVSATRYIIENLANGRYIALCEGDDYWVSCTKLSRQYQYLENNPNCSICLHNSYIVDCSQDVVYLSEREQQDQLKSFGDVVIQGGGLINPTASFFFRRDSYGSWKPGPVGDHFTLMCASQGNGVYWFSEPMSVYRFKSNGSWSSSNERQSVDRIHEYRDSYVAALVAMNEEYDRRFDYFFKKRIKLQIDQANRLGDMIACRMGKISPTQVFRMHGLKMALKAYFGKRSNRLYSTISRIELIGRLLIQRRLVSISGSSRKICALESDGQ